jgi:hypothetical protein
MTMAATRTTPSQKVTALLAKTVANGCTRPEMLAAQETARTLCKKHGLDAAAFTWPDVPVEAQPPAPEAKPATKRKRAPKAASKAEPRPKAKMTWPPVEGGKAHRVYEAIKRDGGATVAELLKLTGWLPHSLRGWVSMANKAGADIASARAQGVTRYQRR